MEVAGALGSGEPANARMNEKRNEAVSEAGRFAAQVRDEVVAMYFPSGRQSFSSLQNVEIYR